VSELDDLERELLEAADTWFSQTLHLKLQRLIAAARDGERWKKTAMEFIARMPNPPKFPLLPSDPVDQPAAPKSSPGGGATASVSSKQFAEPAGMHGNGA
jgi:hypothetical protein